MNVAITKGYNNYKFQFGVVIRGENSSEPTIASTVAFAVAMGKSPIVVNDCPGFLVNRVLFPYICLLYTSDAADE